MVRSRRPSALGPLVLAALLALLLPFGHAAVAARAASPPDRLPTFDAHMHYSADAWELYDVDQIIDLLDRAGVRVAMVSSTPDHGTLRLHERAPDRIVPMLRPYRTRADMSGWTRDPAIASYLRERIASAPSGVRYRGIGEFHLYAGEAENPVVFEAARLARQHGLFLHSHSDERAIEELLRVHPDVKVLWAHAGMSATPETVGRLLDQYGDRLRVELALRYDAGSDDWTRLFLRHPDKLMVGTDTWVPSQWTRLVDLKKSEQEWLGRLPRDVAERLAWRNAACLFGGEDTAIRRPRDCAAS